jgi:hypothetical protein
MSLATILDGTADAIHDATIPTDRAGQDAVIVAAMRLGHEVMRLSQRIVDASREHGPTCRSCVVGAKHPPHDPKPPPPPPPPPKDPK